MSTKPLTPSPSPTRGRGEPEAREFGSPSPMKQKLPHPLSSPFAAMYY
ncbi:hypothetical protein MC7420_4999 [Coleofasciculus chthonoplastes PCC 7420]|uniref:Uncharacterized protein n=1 Tax=Coleofasciculus chthonoplastes PCC 7420 TaxID=118168 RepID=B4VZE6_9CYAN|nr:hypothetical protein MC7420_4999 [Coleofasciculus chthonoplastes PCC 7420]